MHFRRDAREEADRARLERRERGVEDRCMVDTSRSSYVT
jgi:hypothetical protein